MDVQIRADNGLPHGNDESCSAVAERHCGMEWRGLCSSSGFSGPSTSPQRANVTADQRYKFHPFHVGESTRYM